MARRTGGVLDAATVETFLDALTPVLLDARQAIFDCSAVDFCDSSGLRGFLVVRNQLGGHGSVILLDPADGLRRILEITQLTDLLGEPE